MKKNEIQIGGTYRAKVSNALVDVQVIAVSKYGGWDVTNLQTNRVIRVKSAMRFRSLVKESAGAKVPVKIPKSDGKNVTVAATPGSKGFMKKVKAAMAEVPAPLPATIRKNSNSRTCIVLPDRDTSSGRYFRAIELNHNGSQSPLQVRKYEPVRFDLEWKEIPTSDPSRSVRLYIEAARRYGADAEVVEELHKLIPLTDADREAIATRSGASRIGTPHSTVTGGSTMKTAAKGAKGAKGEARRTVASAFQELIRKGGKTDDEIFTLVKKEFGLGDNKRTYVAWYRNYLRKKGEKVPDAIKAKGDVKAPAAKASAKPSAKAAPAKGGAKGKAAPPVKKK